jgi:hypothetical protein
MAINFKCMFEHTSMLFCMNSKTIADHISTTVVFHMYLVRVESASFCDKRYIAVSSFSCQAFKALVLSSVGGDESVGFLRLLSKCPWTRFCFTAMIKHRWKVTQFFPEASSLSIAEPNLLIEIGVGVKIEVTGGVDIQNMVANNESADR